MSSLGISQIRLANLLGVSPATVTRWVRGSHEPTSAAYVQMGNLLGLPAAAYFWERAGLDPSNFPETNLAASVSSLRASIKDLNLVSARKLSRKVVDKKATVVLLPLLDITVYGDECPPSPHMSLTQAKATEVFMAPLSWCPHPENMLCMRLSGDSMTPLISDNSLLCIDTAVTERDALNRKISVFSHRDRGFKVARFQRLPSSDILVSVNHNSNPIDVSDESKWKAIGEVVWWLSTDFFPRDNE
jgi:transcriptional regulator with XRE-family HTH domain